MILEINCTDFVEQRIESAVINFWLPMNLHLWKQVGHKVKITKGNQVIELIEDQSLFVRMLIVAKSRPEIDLKNAIGMYEFSVVPRSLFDASGVLLSAYGKSELIQILEGAGNNDVQMEAVDDDTRNEMPMEVD